MGGGGVQHHAPAALLLVIDPVPILQKAGWAPRGQVWTGAVNLASHTGIRSPDRPARSVVAIPAELSRPPYLYLNRRKHYAVKVGVGMQV
jgi:hypothetical protein